jgi:hypothetical protein
MKLMPYSFHMIALITALVIIGCAGMFSFRNAPGPFYLTAFVRFVSAGLRGKAHLLLLKYKRKYGNVFYHPFGMKGVFVSDILEIKRILFSSEFQRTDRLYNLIQ